MGTPEQYLIVNSPKKAGNGFLTLFLAYIYLALQFYLHCGELHPPGDTNSGPRSRLRLHTLSAATTFLVLLH